MPADNTQYSIVLPLGGEALYKLLAVHFDSSISWLSQVGEVNHGGHDSYTEDQPHIIWHVVSSLNCGYICTYFFPWLGIIGLHDDRRLNKT